MTTSPYAAASPEKLAEIIRQAEARLDAQLTAALGADQRAMTFAGLLVAAVAALLGVALSTVGTESLRAGSIFVSVGLLTSAALAFWSAKPTTWEYVGNEPGQWLDDIQSGGELHNGMAAMAEFYDEMIKANEYAIAAAAWKMTASMSLSVICLGAGIVGALAGMQ